MKIENEVKFQGFARICAISNAGANLAKIKPEICDFFHTHKLYTIFVSYVPYGSFSSSFFLNEK